MLDYLKLIHLVGDHHLTQAPVPVSTDQLVSHIHVIPLPTVTHYPYHLVAVDGSQVYPDRHEGTLAYLIHTAAVIFDYKLHGSTFSVVSRPVLYSSAVSAQEVDEQRTLAEYQLLAEHAREYALIDGSLGAASMPPHILYAGYISKPRDAELLEPVLDVNTRTQVLYSVQARCHYLYMKLPREIARLEIPASSAQDTAALDVLIRMVVDQCNKGDGYPIALAQAHEAAVITARDREFFYSLLRAHNPALQKSLKLEKKNEKLS